MKILAFFLSLILANTAFGQDFVEQKQLIVGEDKYSFEVKHYSPTTSVLSITKNQVLMLQDSLDYYYNGGEYIDINKDGFDDYRITWIGNIALSKLYLFDPDEGSFKEVKNFIKFPAATLLEPHSEFFYSYSRNGCADANWISDLFTIKNSKAVRLGRINGKGCVINAKDGILEIHVYKNEETYSLLENIPLDTINSYEQTKWGFIKAYWENNIERFK